MKKNLFYLSLLLLGLITACTKKTPQPGNSEQYSRLLRTWKVNKVTETTQNVVLYQNPLPAGQSILEDFSRYRLAFAAGTYTLTNQAGVSISGTWELAQNDTRLILNKGVQGLETVLNVNELTASSLKVSYAEASDKTGNRELRIELIPE